MDIKRIRKRCLEKVLITRFYIFIRERDRLLKKEKKNMLIGHIGECVDFCERE